jgi:excisionase family DNA binding protein
MIDRRIATRREAADYLRCTERHIDRMTRDGRLKAFKMGRSVRFWMSDIHALLAA